MVLEIWKNKRHVTNLFQTSSYIFRKETLANWNQAMADLDNVDALLDDALEGKPITEEVCFIFDKLVFVALVCCNIMFSETCSDHREF